MKKKHIVSGIIFSILLANSWTRTLNFSPIFTNEIKNSPVLQFQDAIKDDSSFHYEFDTQGHFSNEDSDEFESKTFQDGFGCGEKIESEGGKTISVKEEEIPNNGIVAKADYNDTNENNDSFMTATSAYSVGTNDGGIYKHWVWCHATISQKTEGILWWKKTYIDKDFYSFDVVSVGTLKVTLSEIPANCDYDLRLYKIDDKLDCSYASCNFESPLATSAHGIGIDEEITISVKPGTYYACVYSYKDQYFDNDNPYKLTFEEDANTSRYGSNYSVETGRNNGDLGAVWCSDYKPLGITPVTISGENSQVGLSNSSTYPYIKHLIDKYSPDEKITYAVLYVWDVELRTLIRSSLQLILEKIYERGETYFNAFNIIWNGVGLLLSAAGLAIGTITFAEIAQLAILSGVITSVSLPMGFVSTIMSYAMGYEFETSKDDLINYLINAISTFETSKGSNNKEVVMLRFKYKFIKKERWYLDWTPLHIIRKNLIDLMKIK